MLTLIVDHHTEQANVADHGASYQSGHHAQAFRGVCEPNLRSTYRYRIQELINRVVNEDTTYAKQPLELRNQRIYAVKSGVNGLLDVARTTYKEASEDAYQHCTELRRENQFS
jgi:hypothetical protein